MIIDPEFKSLLFPLTEDEYRQLKENILRDGCLEPLIVWGEILIDGHNRYQICTENSIPYETKEIHFGDRSEAISWIIKNQFGRRNLTAFQRSELALKLKPMLAEKAKERMESGNNQYSPSNKSDEGEKGRTDDKLGEIAGVSKRTIRNTETILTKGTEKDIQEVREGDVSISKKAKEIKERSKPEKVTPPENKKSDKGDMSKETVDKTLIANLYSVFKTLRGTKEMLEGNLSKQDEKELLALISKLNHFIERKGGIQNEES